MEKKKSQFHHRTWEDPNTRTKKHRRQRWKYETLTFAKMYAKCIVSADTRAQPCAAHSGLIHTRATWARAWGVTYKRRVVEEAVSHSGEQGEERVSEAHLRTSVKPSIRHQASGHGPCVNREVVHASPRVNIFMWKKTLGWPREVHAGIVKRGFQKKIPFWKPVDGIIYSEQQRMTGSKLLEQMWQRQRETYSFWVKGLQVDDVVIREGPPSFTEQVPITVKTLGSSTRRRKKKNDNKASKTRKNKTLRELKAASYWTSLLWHFVSLSLLLFLFFSERQRAAPESLDDTVRTTLVCYDRCFSPLASSPSGKKSL